MRSTAQVRRGWVAVAASLLTILSGTSTPASAQVAPSLYDPREILRAQARFISGYQTLAEIGVAPATLATSAAGAAHPVLLRVLDLKASLSRFAGAASGRGAPSTPANNGVIADPQLDENEPTVAANPRASRQLVAGSHSFDAAVGINHCVASSSSDGGVTWSRPVQLPQLGPESFCSDPVLAWAPDGTRVYYAYMDIKISETSAPPLVTLNQDLDILVSSSTDGGHTWSPPAVALDGDPSSDTFNEETGEPVDFEPGFLYDKPWIASHSPQHANLANGNNVYVSATRFDFVNPGSDCAIAFSRSTDMASTWSRPTQLDSSGDGLCLDVLVQGSRPSAGIGDDVVVAWYHSSDDGVFSGSFEIRTATSTNGGRQWGPPSVAVTDSFEVPFFLGPFAFYHRWFGAMFPDIEIGSDGVAHVAYTHDPEENGFTIIDPKLGELFFPDVSTTAEDGDIRYVHSGARSYGAGSWSAPVTVNDDGLVRAQGYAALETRRGPRGTTPIAIIWEDHRLSPEVEADPDVLNESANLYYDIFSTTFDQGEWSANRRLTDASSISDFIFIGDYFDLTPVDHEGFFAIWTDRRHQTSTGAVVDENGEIIIDEAALEDNIFGARISSR